MRSGVHSLDLLDRIAAIEANADAATVDVSSPAPDTGNNHYAWNGHSKKAT